MPYLPVYIHSSKVRVLIVGGGRIALRKLKSIVNSEVEVTVIAKELSADFKEFIQLHQISFSEKAYEKGDATGFELVIAATDSMLTNDLIQEDAEQLINRVDIAERGNILLPATIRRGELVLTVSTGSASPILAQKIKRELEQKFDDNYTEYLVFLSKVREQFVGNRAILTAVVDEKFINMTDSQREIELESLVNKYL